jgi:hypothetical protein
VNTSDRRMAITFRLHPLVQVPKILLQALPLGFLGDPSHAHRRMLATTVLGPLQSRHIDEMCQRVEPSFGFALRSFHYPQPFR